MLSNNRKRTMRNDWSTVATACSHTTAKTKQQTVANILLLWLMLLLFMMLLGSVYLWVLSSVWSFSYEMWAKRCDFQFLWKMWRPLLSQCQLVLICTTWYFNKWSTFSFRTRLVIHGVGNIKIQPDAVVKAGGGISPGGLGGAVGRECGWRTSHSSVQLLVVKTTPFLFFCSQCDFNKIKVLKRRSSRPILTKYVFRPIPPPSVLLTSDILR